MPVYVIDCGHGGDRPARGSSPLGSIGPAGLREKDVTLRLGQLVAAGLGREATLTRTGDRNLSLGERADLARESGARVFISLHANSGAPGARGAETWTHPRAGGRSRELAEAMRRELGKLGGGPGGVGTAEMAVLTPERLAPATAACLVEVDYLSDPEGERRLQSQSSLDSIARAIVRAARSVGENRGAYGAAAPASERLDGIDVFAGDKNKLPSWADIAADGIRFVYLKSSESNFTDDQFPIWRPQVLAARLLVGAYHFYYGNWKGVTVEAQAQTFVNAVRRVVPGELPPSVDFEHLSDVKVKHANADDNEYNHWHGETWLRPLDTILDTVEAALGRNPMIYTSKVVWDEFVDTGSTSPYGFARYCDYVLWNKMYLLPEASRYDKRLTRSPSLPSAWRRWDVWQYSGDYTPSQYTHLHHSGGAYDFNVFNGSIYRLRGLADLGRVAPYVSRLGRSVAHVESDGQLHLLTLDRDTWRRTNLAVEQGATSAGDPAAGVAGTKEILVYRGDDGHLYQLSRDTEQVPPTWDKIDVTTTAGASLAAGDPDLLVVSPTEYHLVYWDAGDRFCDVWWDGSTWHVEDLTEHTRGGSANGNAAAYVMDGHVHVTGRVDLEGHLSDFYYDGANWQEKDLTQDSGAPAATYRPAAYTRPGETPRIVFRALRGELYEIARDTLARQNLHDLGGGSPTSWGSPVTMVIGGAAHIVYRGADEHLHEIYETRGGWSSRQIDGGANPAADPTCLVVDNVGYVFFRGTDGDVYQLTLDGDAWSWETLMAGAVG